MKSGCMLIAIEEHWTTRALTTALKGLPEGARDESLMFNEMGDKLTRLEDLCEGRIASMDEQGIDLQILGLAPPSSGRPSSTPAMCRRSSCRREVP